MDFTPKIEHIWNKGNKILGCNGGGGTFMIWWDKYGNRKSIHGWEIDHIPNGGDISNL